LDGRGEEGGGKKEGEEEGGRSQYIGPYKRS
jgi:hypothetical protein